VWDWYREAIIDTGRQPVFFAFVAFVVTLVATRTIVRLIRAGKGPFGNVSAGGVHVHHVVPGIVLMTIGGLIALAASRAGPLPLVAGLLFGAGAALVLDEFPLILHLEDVYWEKEGRLSVEATTIAMVLFGLAVMVAAPNAEALPSEFDEPRYQFALAVAFVFTWMIPVTITLLKGKIVTAVLALAFPPIAYVGMIRLARPGSPWAMHRYRNAPNKRAEARTREERLDARTKPIRDLWARAIYGFGSDSQAGQGSPENTDGARPTGDEPHGALQESTGNVAASHRESPGEKIS